MKIALLADIHGNMVALETVLADLEDDRPDELICLGDVAEGPQPRATLTTIRELGCPVVMGNADEDLLSSGPPPDDAVAKRFDDINRWSTDQLAGGLIDAVHAFEPTLERATDDFRVFACHGSPRSTTDAINVTMTAEQLDRRFGSVDADVIAVAHTHTQFCRPVRSQLLLNPGSVGLPFATTTTGTVRNPPWAEYAVISHDRGRIDIDLRRTPVDVTAVVDAIEASEMPHANWWADGWRDSAGPE